MNTNLVVEFLKYTLVGAAAEKQVTHLSGLFGQFFWFLRRD